MNFPFPADTPKGYELIDDPVEFDATKHLDLQSPETAWSLSDLGYTGEEIEQCPTSFAISSPARLLSDAGVAALKEVALRLKRFAVSCERVDNMVRGGVYQSRFLRDLCTCPEVTAFMSEIFGAEIIPHTMPSQLGHLNFTPRDLSQAVDKWHYDTLGLDYVMMVSDPAELNGGEFQYFLGTRADAADYADAGTPIPAERVVSPQYPGAGYVVPMQGSMVVHRGARLVSWSERITMVNGYVPLDRSIKDHNRFRDLKQVDPHHVLFAEWARHKAWLAQGNLQELIETLPFAGDRNAVISALAASVREIEAAIADLSEDDEAPMSHFGDLED